MEALVKRPEDNVIEDSRKHLCILWDVHSGPVNIAILLLASPPLTLFYTHFFYRNNNLHKMAPQPYCFSFAFQNSSCQFDYIIDLHRNSEGNAAIKSGRMAACSDGGGHFGGHTISHSAGSLTSQSIGLKKSRSSYSYRSTWYLEQIIACLPGQKVRKVCIFTKIFFFTVKFFKVSAWLPNHTVCKIGLRADSRIREARKVVISQGHYWSQRDRESWRSISFYPFYLRLDILVRWRHALSAWLGR